MILQTVIRWGDIRDSDWQKVFMAKGPAPARQVASMSSVSKYLLCLSLCSQGRHQEDGHIFTLPVGGWILGIFLQEDMTHEQIMNTAEQTFLMVYMSQVGHTWLNSKCEASLS